MSSTFLWLKGGNNKLSKVKVKNNNKFNVGVRFENEANREVTIKAKTFLFLGEDDIQYINAVSNLISDGILSVEDVDVMQSMGYVKKSPNAITDEEIEKLFKLSATKLKVELEKIDAKHAIDKIVELAKKEDLPQSKLKIIKEVLNIEIFEEIDNEVV